MEEVIDVMADSWKAIFRGMGIPKNMQDCTVTYDSQIFITFTPQIAKAIKMIHEDEARFTVGSRFIKGSISFTEGDIIITENVAMATSVISYFLGKLLERINNTRKRSRSMKYAMVAHARKQEGK